MNDLFQKCIIYIKKKVNKRKLENIMCSMIPLLSYQNTHFFKKLEKALTSVAHLVVHHPAE